jgi:hypothetical protein
VCTGSEVLSLPSTHEEQQYQEQQSTHVNEGCGFDVGNMENLDEPGWSVHASNLGSESNGISPKTNSVSHSYNGPFEPSININNDDTTCLICYFNTPDIKLKVHPTLGIANVYFFDNFI